MGRVGIFAGSFDPVHKGHMAFALQALKRARLDEVFFLPEIQPRAKANITHIGHRVAMLKLALKPHPKLRILELPDKQFTVSKTLPKLMQKFPNDELFLLMGSDVLANMPDWPNFGYLLKNVGIVVASREEKTKPTSSIKPRYFYSMFSPEPNISSNQIRTALQKGKCPKGLLNSIQNYINKNWLYSAV